MYYNVLIRDGDINEITTNQLIFHFQNDFEKALKFVKKILEISNYEVEILPFLDNEEN